MNFDGGTKYNIKSTEISYSKKLPLSQIKQYEGKLINKLLEKKSHKIALNIILYREVNGYFKSINELLEVKYIGEKTFENVPE